VAYEKFVPDIPPLHEPFWESVRAQSMKLQQCDDCGAFRFIPFEICNKCHSESCTWTTISGRGTIYTYTIVHRAPTPAYQKDAPYVIVHVVMQEGPRISGNLIGCPHDQVAIGMPVELTYEVATPELTLYKFRPESVLA
jgi:uncharacterized OB-fold protein